MQHREKATIQAVAKLAGVSSSTVSMILSGRPNVSFAPETTSRVYHAAAALGYDRTPAQKRLFDRPTIAIFLPIITGSYYTFISQAITQQANAQGYDTICLETHRAPDRELRLMHMVKKTRADGIIFTVPPINQEAAAELAQHIPTVAISSTRTNMPMDTVMTDDYHAGTLLARHLLSLGHRDAAFIHISREWQNVPASRRLDGVTDAFNQTPGARLKVYARPAPDTLKPGSFLESRSLARDMTRECLKREAPTAFIGVSDYAAYGVMDALNEYHFHVPQDFSVCSFDDIFSSSIAAVSLTSINRHPIQTGISAFQLLMEKIAGRRAALSEPIRITQVEYVSQLMKRGSTAPPRRHSIVLPG